MYHPVCFHLSAPVSIVLRPRSVVVVDVDVVAAPVVGPVQRTEHTPIYYRTIPPTGLNKAYGPAARRLHARTRE